LVYVFIFNKLTDLFKHYVVYCISWHLVYHIINLFSSVFRGVQHVDLTPAHLSHVRAARSKYQQHLDSQKALKVQTVADEAKKRKNEELQEFHTKRRCLQTDAESLEADADKLAQQAENTSKLTLLAKSNAVRRGAKVKRAELQKIDEAIATHQL
jgi:hypothetical protein